MRKVKMTPSVLMLVRFLTPLLSFVSLVSAHTVLTYPGWRGNNLGITEEYPYGMQWSYPCGGLPLTKNRTSWPLTGGGIAFQPGWYTGHSKALIYINIGFGNDGPDGGPRNLSKPLQKPFQILGPPGDDPYPGTVCLPQVPMVKEDWAGRELKVGDLATLQVVQISTHGAAQYNCVDIILSLPADAPTLDETNCFNSSTIRIINDPFVASQVNIRTHNISSATTETESSNQSTNEEGCPVCDSTPTSCPVPSPSSCPRGNGGTGGGIGRAKREGWEIMGFIWGIGVAVVFGGGLVIGMFGI